MIKPPASATSLSSQLSALAGTKPDAHVATELGLPLQVVKDYRTAAKIAAYKQAPPAAAKLAPTPSIKAATAGTVVRRRAGVESKVGAASSARPSEPSAPAKAAPVVAQPAPGAAAGHKLDPFRHRMGVERDENIAAEAGVHRTSVGDYRRANRIPPYRGHYEPKVKVVRASAPTSPKAATPKAASPKVVTPKVVTPKVVTPEVVTPKVVKAKTVTGKAVEPKSSTANVAAPAKAAVERKPTKLSGFEQLIGVESDASVARKAGASPRLVRMYRDRHGIPTPPVSIRTRPPRVAKKAANPARIAKAKAAAASAPAPSANAVVKSAQSPSAAKAASSTAPAVANVVAQPPAKRATARVASSASPARTVQLGFRVLAQAKGVTQRFVAVGVDMSDAVQRAARVLAERPGGPWRIVKIALTDEFIG